MFWECSDLTHQFVWFVVMWSREPQHWSVLKIRAWGWHSSRGCNPSFYWHHWAGSFRGGGGGWGALWRAQHAPAHERPGWPFPLRRLDAKAQATGRSEQRCAWLWESPREGRAGLGATLTPSSSLSTQWPCLISGHPERADIRATWSEELPPTFNEQLVYRNNPS